MPKRVLEGVVVSDKNDKTIVVKVERRLTHPVLKKTVRLTKKYHAHDEKNTAKVGDIVWIEETKPLSKQKRWLLVDKAGQATLVGDVFDDAATGQGLLNYFLRALNCGAITEQEALAPGLSLEELRGRSFVKILKSRRKA